MRQRFTLAVLGLAAISASLAFAQTQKDPTRKPTPPTTPGTAAPQHKPGDAMPQMSEADKQACMEAAKPGEMHAHLTKAVGQWTGKCTSYMSPEPTQSETKTTITSMFDGRYTKVETSGEMPEMGPFNGFGLYGYDNVVGEFQCVWIDNCGTGIATGTGQLSSDKKTMTWKYTFNCPITKQPMTIRHVDRYTGPNSMTMELYGQDPTSGKEFKMMECAYTRKPGTAAASATGTR